MMFPKRRRKIKQAEIKVSNNTGKFFDVRPAEKIKNQNSKAKITFIETKPQSKNFFLKLSLRKVEQMWADWKLNRVRTQALKKEARLKIFNDQVSIHNEFSKSNFQTKKTILKIRTLINCKLIEN